MYNKYKNTCKTHINFEYFKNLGALFKKIKSQFGYCSHSHCLVSVLFKLSHPDKVDFQWKLHLKSFSAKRTKEGNALSFRLFGFKL